MRIALAEFKQESNTFSPVAGDWFHFREGGYLFVGDQILTRLAGTATEVGGAIGIAKKQAGVELLPLLAASAGASAGPMGRGVFLALMSQITEPLKSLGALDGLLLCLHGAMVAESADDASGEILSAVREVIGSDTPLALTLDLHANVTQKMADLADIIVGYQTSPHTDMERTGAHAMQLLIDTIARRIAPVVSLCKLPMILPSERCDSTRGPFAEVMREVHSLEEDNRVLSANAFLVQPWLDIPGAGCSVVVVTDGNDSQGSWEAQRIAGMLWERRSRFIVTKTPPDEAIQRAAASNQRPFVFSDGSDAPSAGSTGDSVEILRALLQARFDEPVLVNVVDREVVQTALKAGVGQTITESVGGKLAPQIYRPVELRATVKLISDGDFTHKGPGFYGMTFRRGSTVVLQSGPISLVVSERPALQWDAEFYRSLGLEPTDAKIVVVKSPGGFRAVYEPMSAEIVEVDVPGISSSDLTGLPWKRISRPIYPLDEMVVWKLD